MGTKKAKKKHRTKIMCSQGTMDSAMGDLLTMSKSLESHELAKIRFTPERLSTMDELLSDTYVRQSPKPIDYQNRLDLVQIFNIIAREIYDHSNNSPVVEGYGSFVMDMFNEKSDLDMSINFVNSKAVDRKKKISTLRKFTRTLYAIQRVGHITSVSLIETARVPIIKLTDRGTGIECDLSVENRDGIAKSHIIHAISAIDERFRRLCFLMKSWAKAHNINSSKDRTLNSLSIVSLVAFHLQTCSPPILPPFSALLKDGADPASVVKVVKSYLNYGENNKDSLAKLFITLFVKLASVEQLWKNGLCVSLFQGSWVSKSWARSYSIRIEDFTDRSQNVARAVGVAQFGTIYGCIRASLHHLMEYLNDKMLDKDLFDYFFGAAFDSTPGIGGTSNKNHDMNNHHASMDPPPSKKRPLEEQGLEQSQAKRQAWQGAKPQRMGGMQHVGTPIVHNVPVSGRSSGYRGQPKNNVPASFTPLASHQPPFVIPGTSISVQDRCYGPRKAPPGPIGPNNPPRLPQPFHTQTSHSFVQYSHQEVNVVSPTGIGAIRTHLPPASAVAPTGIRAIHPHQPPASVVAPTGIGAFHPHRPPASVVAPIGGAIHPHLPPASVVAPTGIGAIRPHLPPASHNPYGGYHTLHDHRRY